MDKNIVVLVASYDSVEEAESDFRDLDQLAQGHILDDVSLALVRKVDGKIHTTRATNAGKAGATVGALGGVIIGALFPPAGLAVLGGMIAGGMTLGLFGGAIGHFAGGVSRKDLKELGESLEDGDAAVIVVIEDEHEDKANAALAKAQRKASRKLDKGDVEGALEELDKGVVKAEEERLAE